MRCTYCLCPLHPDQATDDHVLARSWFPRNTPPVAKWKVPSCRACNSAYSAIEKTTLNRLAWTLNPQDTSVADVIGRARRATDPKAASSHKDMVARMRAKLALRQDIVDVTDSNAPGLLPTTLRNFHEGSRTGLRVPGAAIEGVVKKWIRGLQFCEVGFAVPLDSEVEAYFVGDEQAAEAFAEIFGHARHIRKGPGVEVLIWHAVEDATFSTSYAFNIWNSFRAYGNVTGEPPGS